MKYPIIKSGATILFLLFVNTANVTRAADIEGQWCEDGKPYACYPPVTNPTETYICTDNTAITHATQKTLQWVVGETVHFYSDGLTNGKTKSQKYTWQFTNGADTGDNVFEYREETGVATRLHKLIVKNNKLAILFEQIPHSSDASRIHKKTIYKRCDDKLNKEAYYTALVDCRGTGDYIAGVPAVVEDPLQWVLDPDKKHGASCRVAAKCWGGGWVAYAYSDADNIQGKAFGAACGGASRHDAKQQAINTCRESGGENCLFTVVSSFDNGNTESSNIMHKGINVESCSNGDCKKLASD